MLLLMYRFKGLPGIVAFDLDSFLSMVQRSRKWQDPHTLKNVTIKQLQPDSWMQPILSSLKVYFVPPYWTLPHLSTAPVIALFGCLIKSHHPEHDRCQGLKSSYCR